MGSLSTADGEGLFRFGASTAATQIEDQNPNTDWAAWSTPEEEGGLGEGHEAIGDAVLGFTKAVDDIDLLTEMNLDAYRFSLSWSRIEPTRDSIVEESLVHYDTFIDELIAADIRPMITLHHFSNPLWTNNFLQGCEDGPTEETLCGWADPASKEALLEEISEYGALIAARYGDRVDEWCTVNEPVNYLLASYGFGVFPPGESNLFGNFDRLVDSMRTLIAAHVALYDAIKANDTVDADGDGLAASVGFSLSVAEWAPARDGALSEDPEDIAAAERVQYVYHHLFPRSILNGTFDADLDQEPEETHPDWEGKLDWLGLQYYFRAGVTGKVQAIPGVDAMICVPGFEDLDGGACLYVDDETKWVPTMSYEYYEPGLGDLLLDFSQAYPTIPMAVTEAGIATSVGARRAENIVRSLEQIERAIDGGADVRGYYHWSLTDNFEWAEGYGPQFGLYSVDRSDFSRTPTLGAEVFGDIAKERTLTESLRETHGGLGPMTPEL